MLPETHALQGFCFHSDIVLANCLMHARVKQSNKVVTSAADMLYDQSSNLESRRKMCIPKSWIHGYVIMNFFHLAPWRDSIIISGYFILYIALKGLH